MGLPLRTSEKSSSSPISGKDLGGRMDQQDVAPGWSTLAHATLPRLRRTGGEKPLTLGGKIVVIRCGEVSNHAARNAHFIGTSGNRDTNHRTAGFAGRTRRRGGSMAARGGSALQARAGRPLPNSCPCASVLRMRFGIGMNKDHTLEEVGLQFSVRRERIRQIEAKALRKLKHPSRSRILRSFLDN